MKNVGLQIKIKIDITHNEDRLYKKYSLKLCNANKQKLLICSVKLSLAIKWCNTNILLSVSPDSKFEHEYVLNHPFYLLHTGIASGDIIF